MIILANNNKGENAKQVKRPIAGIITAVAIILALSAVSVISAVNFSRANEIDQRTQQLSEECESVKSVVEKDKEIIGGKGFDEYCEEIAREQYGYAKPGEYILYDSSFGN